MNKTTKPWYKNIPHIWEIPEDWNNNELWNFSSITTWRLDANAMVEDWEYRFYTCAKKHYHINEYAFDTEALLISWNWANVWYIHYFKNTWKLSFNM